MPTVQGSYLLVGVLCSKCQYCTVRVCMAFKDSVNKELLCRKKFKVYNMEFPVIKV